MNGNLEVKSVTKFYKKFKAVDSASIVVKQGEFFTILGPSGSGKTTLLKLIAGFEALSSGSIVLNSRNIASQKPYERNIGMVFQNYALFPHMTVAENIAYPLRRRKVKKKEIEQKIKEVLKTVHLEIYENHYPSQLSGGQQQRVALARAIVFSPPLLLLDEPLGALDKKLRQQMQLEIKSIQKSLGITTVSVTHDQEEALTMSDKICVMNHGRIEQIDTPENIYKHPKNRFVAEFIGEINLLEGDFVSAESNNVKVKLLDNKIATIRSSNAKQEANSLLVALRPENIQLETDDSKFVNSVDVKVNSIIYLGEAVAVNLETASGEKLNAKIPSVHSGSIVEGRMIRVGWNPEDATILSDDSIQNSSNEKNEKLAKTSS